MIQKIPQKIGAMPALVHLGMIGAAYVGFILIKGRLDSSYEASGHPVDYATGQTSFSAEIIEGYYAAMQAQGTLDVYVKTQVIDFGFIAMIVLLAVLIGSLVMRVNSGNWGKRIGLGGMIAGVAGAAADTVENLISFWMLAQPDDISNPVAMVYSTFAVMKFGLLTLAMGLVLLGFVWAAVTAVARRFA